MSVLPQKKELSKEIDQLDEMIFKFARGEREVFTEFYLSTQNTVYCYILSIIGDRVQAEDIMQETYLKILEKSDTYVSQNKPMAWIFTIAKNLCRGFIRSNKKLDSLENETSIADDKITDPGERLLIETTLKILNETERQVILLNVVNGYKYREISKILGTPLGTVLSQASRGMKKLKKALQEAGYDE